MDSVSMIKEIRSSIIAGLTSATLCNPLEVLRNRVIVSHSPTSKTVSHVVPSKLRNAIMKIYDREGLKGFWKGYRINAISYPVFYGFFFPVYESGKYFLKHNTELGKFQISLLASIVSGFAADVLTNPLWVMKTRIQTSSIYDEVRKAKYRTMISTFKHIWNEVLY